MTILMLVTRRQYRGAEISAFNLSMQLQKEGFTVIWVGLYPANGDAVELPNARNIDLPGQKTGLFNFRKFRALKKLVEQFNPDIIQANGSDTLIYAMLVKTIPGNKYPIVYRNISIISVWMGNGFKKLFYRLLFRQVDRVVSVGEAARKDFLSTLAYPEKRISVIHRGIPVIKVTEAEKDNIRNAFQLEPGKKVVMHIGHFSAEKNHHFLVDCWQMLQKQEADYYLILLGNGPLYDSILSDVLAKNLQHRILMPGLQTNSQAWLAIAQVLLLCSTVEGVPGVVLEAAAQGVPAIAVNVGGAGEVIKDGESGRLLPDHDKLAFCKAITEMLGDEGNRQRMGEKGRELVLNEFTIEANTRQFISLYKKLAKPL